MKAFSKSLLALIIACGLMVVGSAVLLAVDDGAQADPATLTIAHFAPFGATITDTAVSIYVNGSETLSNLVFSEGVAGVKLPAGVYSITISPTVGSPVVQPLTVTAGTSYFVAAIGGANGWPVELYSLVNDTTPLTDSGKIRFTHLAPFVATSSATRVDICADATSQPVVGLTNIAYKDTTGYLSLPPGIYDLFVSPAGGSCTFKAVDLPPFVLDKGQVADVFAIGLLSPPADPSLALQSVAIGLRARVNLAHFAPFTTTTPITNTSVTVRIGGQDLFTNVTYLQSTGYITFFPGAAPVEIIPTGSITPIITGTAVVTSYLDYTFAAIGDGINQPLEIFSTLDDNVTPPPSGQARVRIGHLAPFNASIANTKVDICTTVGGTPLVNDIEYKQLVTVNLPAGIYRGVFIANPSPDCALPIAQIPTFSVGAGQIAYVYAVGDGINAPVTVVSSPNLLVNAYLFLMQLFKDVTPAR